MANDHDTVAFPVGHLRALERVLDAAYGAIYADDLARQFRALQGRPQPSNLSRALDDQLTRVRGYIRDADNDESEFDNPHAD